jgi:hypothetical protein
MASKKWHEDINSVLLSLNFRHSNTDPNLYMRCDILLLLYVNDILVIHTDNTAGEEVKKPLNDKFKISNLGPATEFLGLEIELYKDGITSNQLAYIETIIRHFDMHKMNGVSTPMDPNVKLYEYEEDKGFTDTALYQLIIRSLMYATLGTCPDLAYTVVTLSRYSAKPQTRHITTAKRALQYLKKSAHT